MAEVAAAGLPVRPGGRRPRRGQPPVRRRSAQARADLGAGRRRDHHRLHRRPVRRTSAAARTSPAPAGSSTSSCCPPPAPTGGATSAARCSSGSTARPGSRRKSWTRISTGSRRRASGTTGAWARSWTCSCSTRSPRARRSGPTAAPRWCNVLNDYVREPQQRERLPGDQDAAAVQQEAVGDLGPLGQVPGEHVPGAATRRPASTTSRSSR